MKNFAGLKSEVQTFAYLLLIRSLHIMADAQAKYDAT